jgi:ketosteroid isomerase-like protein
MGDDVDMRMLADRIEIDDLITRYSTAIDNRDFDLLDTVFTEDADLDYDEVGDFRGDRAAFKAWMAEVAPLFSMWLHHATNRAITLEGDTATAVTYLLNPVVLDGRPGVLTEGGRYHDRLVRTEDGWRIVARREEPMWHDWPSELRP